MPQKTKFKEIKSEFPQKDSQVQICSDSLEITPQFQGSSRLPFKRKLKRATQKPPEIPKAEPLPQPILELFAPKPQIQSIPGIPATTQNRYRVVLGAEVIGARLSLDEALKLAKGGKA